VPAVVKYVIDGHTVELRLSADGERWVCDCAAYASRTTTHGPRCTHEWEAFLFEFTERVLRAEGVAAPVSVH